MKIKFKILIFFVLAATELKAQVKLVINNDAFVVLNDAAFLVIDNASSEAISTTGTGGNLISEGEENSVLWNIKDSVGTYTIPFTTTPVSQGGNGTKIPTTLDITRAGSNNGSILFSTYETDTDMNTNYPSNVTSMYSSTLGGDGSLYAVDRFWMIDATSYTTKPEGAISLSYDDETNEIAVTNLLTESNLQAQRWSTSAVDWEGIMFGTINTTNNTVFNINLTSSDFYSTWTLVDASNPLASVALPVSLVSFELECIDEGISFTWETDSELNNNYFIIQESTDLIFWEDLTIIPSNRDSQNNQVYSESIREHNLSAAAYYRLVQVDSDEKTTFFDMVYKSCDKNIIPKPAVYPNPNNGQITIDQKNNELLTIRLYDTLGRLVLEELSADNTTTINANVAPGMYHLILSTPTNQYSFKLSVI